MRLLVLLLRTSGDVSQELCCKMKENTVLPSKYEDFTIIRVTLADCWLVVQLAFKQHLIQEQRNSLNLGMMGSHDLSSNWPSYGLHSGVST